MNTIGSHAFNQAFGKKTTPQNRTLIIKVPSSVTTMRQYSIAHLESLIAQIEIGLKEDLSNLTINASDKPIINSNGDGESYDICSVTFYTNKYTAQSDIM